MAANAEGDEGLRNTPGHTASCKCNDRWIDLDIDRLIAKRGADWIAWDPRPPCSACGTPGHYLASPGPSTSYRPLRTGYKHEADRKAFLLGFGFTKRDIVRIRAMTDTTTANYAPAALNDLDVPFRIGAAWPGTERHSSGQVLDEWKGRVLLYWPMRVAERGTGGLVAGVVQGWSLAEVKKRSTRSAD